ASEVRLAVAVEVADHDVGPIGARGPYGPRAGAKARPGGQADPPFPGSWIPTDHVSIAVAVEVPGLHIAPGHRGRPATPHHGWHQWIFDFVRDAHRTVIIGDGNGDAMDAGEGAE